MSTGSGMRLVLCSQEDGWGNPRESMTFQTPIEIKPCSSYLLSFTISRFPDMCLLSLTIFFIHFYIYHIKNLHLKCMSAVSYKHFDFSLFRVGNSYHFL